MRAPERNRPTTVYAHRMTGPRSRFESDSAAPVTGVASGGLGTAANLEDTQILRNQDLAEAAASQAEPVEHVAAPAPAPASVAPQPSAPVARPKIAPVPAAPVRPTVAARGTSSNRRPGRGLAGLLAAALVVLAGVAFVVSRGDDTLGAGQALPSVAAPATAAPDANADDRKEPDDRDDRGKDKDKPCHGNGNGRGNGCDDD